MVGLEPVKTEEEMIFTHNPIIVPKLKRIDLPGIRFYENQEQTKKFVSITSVISHNTKHKFVDWRKEKGEKEANRITTRSTKRGTKMHSLIEAYVRNEPEPTPEELFTEKDDHKIPQLLNEGETIEDFRSLPYFLYNNLKPELNKLNNILGIEISLYSEYFGFAGTSDCIAEYDGVLSIIDYKTSDYIKRKDWIFDYFVQAVAYRYMLKERTGLDAPQLVVFMAAENGQIKVFIERDFNPYARRLVEYIERYRLDKSLDSY